MKVLVTGIKGQLGYDVCKELSMRNIPFRGVDMEDFDITEVSAVIEAITAYNPEAVIHCAAYTAVDKAEDNTQLCEKVNVQGSINIAKACKKIGAKMLYISTDYVFPGTGDTEYETNDEVHPLSVYGRTKLEGELAVQKMLTNYFIIRTSWVFGTNGMNFVKTMLRLSKVHAKIDVVDDQIGSPTYTVDLARLLCDMVVSDKYGVYHATNEGFCSWAEFAQEIFKLSGITAVVNPIPTRDYPARAVRPLNSRLSKRSLSDAGFHRLPTWQNAIGRYLMEL